MGDFSMQVYHVAAISELGGAVLTAFTRGCGKFRFSSLLWSTNLNQTQLGFEIRSPIPLREQSNTRLLTFWSACLGLFFHR